MRILRSQSRDPWLLGEALKTVESHNLTEVADEVLRLTQHYSTRLRERATIVSKKLGITRVPPFNPVQSLEFLEQDLAEIASLVPIPVPPDARWVHVTGAPRYRMVPRFQLRREDEPAPRELSGWLLGENENQIRLLDCTGSERVLESSRVTIRPGRLEDEKSRRPSNLRMPPGLLPAAWALQRGDRATAAALAIPIYDEATRPSEVRELAFDEITRHLHARLEWAFELDRDYVLAAALASRLYEVRYEEYLQPSRFWAREDLLRLAEDLADPSTTPPDFFLPRLHEWERLRGSLPRAQQVDYLVSHLRAAIPSGVTVLGNEPASARRFLDPEKALREMALTAADVPALVAHLHDHRCVPLPLYSHSSSRAAQRQSRPGWPRRVSMIVVRLVNSIARRKLIDPVGFHRLSALETRRVADETLRWSLERLEFTAAEVDQEIFLTATDPTERLRAAERRAEAGDSDAIDYILQRADEDEDVRESFLLKRSSQNSPAAVPYVRRWLAEANREWDSLSAVQKAELTEERYSRNLRLFAALILLRWGDRVQREGLDTILQVLEADHHGFEYGYAWDDLWVLEDPDVNEALLRVLDKPSVFDRLGAANSLLPCRLFRSGRRRFIDIVQQRLGTTGNRGRGYSLFENKGDPTEGDRVAELLAEWAGPLVAEPYLFAAPDDVRAAQRRKLSVWLDEQYVLMAVGNPNHIRDGPCRIRDGSCGVTSRASP